MNHSLPRTAVTAAFVLIAIVGLPAEASDEVCSRPVIVWDHKVKRAEREGLKVEARAEALAELGRQAWNVTLYVDHSERVSRIRSGPDGGFSEDEIVWRFGRALFEVNDDLQGGRFEFTGDRRFSEVRYCVDRAKYESARHKIEQRRVERIASLRDRFAIVEQAIADDDIQGAGDLFPNLKRDVNLALAEDEIYRSVITGEDRPFSWWISTWGAEVRSARTYSLYCAETAREFLAEGHLQQAENHAIEALDADSRNVVALQVRHHISDLRLERQRLFDQAEQSAAVGRGAAARRYLRRAEEIDDDDLVSLDRSAMRVDALLTQYLAFNPRWKVSLGFAWGSMAVDEEATLSSITKSSAKAFPSKVEAQTPMMLDLEIRSRLGRWMQVWGSVGYGRASATGGTSIEELMDLRSYQAGLGFRTSRGKQSPVSLQLGGGIVHEQIELNRYEGVEEGRFSPFARVAIEGQHIMLFAQYAFDFEDENQATGSPIVWSNGYQFGLKWSFK